MTAVSPAEAAPLADRRARAEPVSSERRGRERRKGAGQINRVAPRMSRLQFIGALATVVSISVVTILVLGMVTLGIRVPMAAGEAIGLMLGLSVLMLVMGSIEQRLIEVRLELMMLNGGQRQADRAAQDERRS